MLVSKIDGKYLVINGLEDTYKAINDPVSQGKFVARKNNKVISESWQSSFICSVAHRAIEVALEAEGFHISFHKYHNCD